MSAKKDRMEVADRIANLNEQLFTAARRGDNASFSELIEKIAHFANKVSTCMGTPMTNQRLAEIVASKAGR